MTGQGSWLITEQITGSRMQGPGFNVPQGLWSKKL